jgi:hypothetical protein
LFLSAYYGMAHLTSGGAYDPESHRKVLKQLDIEELLDRKSTPHGSGQEVYRWAVELMLGWFHRNRRIRTRYERRGDLQQAFLESACINACFNFLRSVYC